MTGGQEMSGSYFHMGLSTCPDCGKRRYGSRKDAKRAARARHPGDHLAEYRCGGFWHVGHLPQAAALGLAGRAEVYRR